MSAEDKPQEASPVAGAAPAITYEGVDMSRHDERYRRTYSLPGERVCHDPNSAIDGIQPDTEFGTEPRTIVATIVTATEEKNANGGGRVSHTRVTYEFEGVEGRHDARAFQPAAQPGVTSGVIAERGGRLWFAPIDLRVGRTWADDVVMAITAAGPAREVIGFGSRGMEEYHADSFDGFRAEVAAVPVFGEFSIQPAPSSDDRLGPIRLLSAPMMEGADDRVLSVAQEAIDAVMLTEKMDRAVARPNDFAKAVGHDDGGERPTGGLLAQASKLETIPTMVSSRGRQHAEPVVPMIANRDSGRGR